MSTSRTRVLAATVAAALLVATAVPIGAMAAGSHDHAGHAAAGALQLTLDNGQKWRTDEPLRQGMGEMRRALAASLPRVHEGAFSPEDYERLASAMEQQVEYVTSNCRLPPDADMQLHVVLAQILEGVGQMRGGEDRKDGAAQVARALDAYAEHFDHPDWNALPD